MRLSGTFTVSSSPAEVYRFLIDPARVVGVLPDIQSAEIESDGFRAEVRVGAGPMRGVFKTRFGIVEREPDRRAVYRGQASGLASVVDVTAAFALRDAENSATTVEWSSEARIRGWLASVPGGLVESLAGGNVKRFVAAVQGSLEKPPAGEGQQ